MAPNTVNVNEKVNLPQKAETKITMQDWIRKSEKQIARALPSSITPERFARMAMTAVTMTPKLGECTPASFIGAMLTAASLGLEPNTPLGQAYLIPYFNGKTKQQEVQFQIGYRGLIELAHRSGEFQTIEAHVVRENDYFDFEYGLHPDVKHKPAMENRGEITWVYAVYHLRNGGFGFEVMSKADIEAHRQQFSKATGFSPWQTAWEEMAKKTVIKRALKYAPLKSEFVKQMNNEDVTLNFKESFETPEEAVVSDEETRYPDAVEVEVEVVAENATTTEDGPSEELKNADPFTEAMADIEEKAKGKK